MGAEKSKPTAEIFNISALTHVSGASLIFELGEDFVYEYAKPLEKPTTVSYEQDVFMALSMSENAAQEVFEDIPSEIVWDDDLPHDRGMHDGLLKQLAGEKAVEQAGQDQRVTEKKLVANMASSLSDGASHEPFDNIPLDELAAPYLNCVEVLLPVSSEAAADKGFNEMSSEMVVWDEERSMIELNTNVDGLEQFDDKPPTELA